MSRKLTQEEAVIAFRARGLLLNDTYTHNTVKVNAACIKCGYSFKVTHRKSSGCPECGKKLNGLSQRNNPEIARERLLEKGFVLMSLYTLSHEKVDLKCIKCDHIFKAAAHSVINTGSGCPECYKRRRKHGEEAVKIKLLERGMILKSPYVGVQKKLDVVCVDKNHSFKATFNSIVNGGWGCPHCYKDSRHLTKDKVNQKLSLKKNRNF